MRNVDTGIEDPYWKDEDEILQEAWESSYPNSAVLVFSDADAEGVES